MPSGVVGPRSYQYTPNQPRGMPSSSFTSPPQVKLVSIAFSRKLRSRCSAK